MQLPRPLLSEGTKPGLLTFLRFDWEIDTTPSVPKAMSLDAAVCIGTQGKRR